MISGTEGTGCPAAHVNFSRFLETGVLKLPLALIFTGKLLPSDPAYTAQQTTDLMSQCNALGPLPGVPAVCTLS